jgi:hypothetical protein
MTHLNSHDFNSNNFNNKTSLQNTISNDVSSIYSEAINFISNINNIQTEQKSHISISTENINQIDSFFNNLQPNKNEQSNYLQCINFINEYS